MLKDITYLDHNATTPLLPEVASAMAELTEFPLNASSSHKLGQKAKGYLEEARSITRNALNAWDYEVIFTATGTEANNLAMRGLPEARVLISAIEHASVLNAREDATIIPVTKEGLVNLDVLENTICNSVTNQRTLVSVMLANNETGILQPLKEVVAIARRYGALVHTDASQAIGKIVVDVAALGVDMLTLSAHKFGGPQGAAALLVKKPLHLTSILKGGGQEKRQRAGTENVIAIHGMGVALHYVKRRLEEGPRIKALRNRFEDTLKRKSPQVVIIGKDMPRLPGTSLFALPGVAAQTQMMHFDLADIAVSNGAACSSGKVGSSHVLHAMQVPFDLARCAIRVSFGYENDDTNIDSFLTAWDKLCQRTKGHDDMPFSLRVA